MSGTHASGSAAATPIFTRPRAPEESVISSPLTAGLPVPGYRPQTQEALDLVGLNKAMEERTLRILDGLAARGDIDPYWLKLGRAQIESGWMAVNRAVFRPDRASLPEDGPVPEAAPATAAAPAAAPTSALPPGVDPALSAAASAMLPLSPAPAAPQA